jgi:hypothetical protein
MHRFCFVYKFFVFGGKQFWNSALGMANKGKLICWGNGDLEVERVVPYGALNSMHVIQPKCRSVINRFSFA